MQQKNSFLRYLNNHTFSNDLLPLKLIMISVDYWFVSLSSLGYLKFSSEILGLVNKLL